MSVLLNIVAAYSVLVIAWIIWQRKTSASILPLILGMFSYMCISLLRGIARGIILNDDVRTQAILFYFLSALLSGVFEEAGRYFVFRPFIGSWVDCVSYGIGHSAIETILTHRVWEGDIFDNFFISYDLVAYALFSVAMSALVYIAANYADSKKFLAAAIVLHTLIDFMFAGYFIGTFSIGEHTIMHVLFIIGACYFSYRVYQHFSEYSD